MRVLIVTFALLCALVFAAAAQQANSSSDEPKGKKTKTTEPAAKAQEKKPSQPAEKPTEPAPVTEEQKPAGPKPGTDKDKEEYDVSEVPPVVTHHQITLDGKLLKYTATTGRLPIKRGDGKIEAEMFFVAYTLDGQDAGKRPLTFAFNGGPGSATIWLHMGALGPRRVVMQPDGFMPPAPYHIADNPYTLLDKSDLVLVDAMSTGFSRAANAELSKKFLGVKGDIEAFSEFIRLYLTRYERWSSPLFLFGESYGTTRAAGIAGNLAGPGHLFQWHHPALDRAQLSDAGGQQEQRPALHSADSQLHHDRRLSQEIAARPDAGHEQGAAGVRAMGLDRIRRRRWPKATRLPRTSGKKSSIRWRATPA